MKDPNDGNGPAICFECQCELPLGVVYEDENLCSVCEGIETIEKDLEGIFGKKIFLIRDDSEDWQAAGFFPNGNRAIFNETEVVFNPTADSPLWNWQPATIENILKAATGCWDE